MTVLAASKKRNQLEKWLTTELPARLENRLLTIHGKIAELWGAMAGQAQLNGIALAIIDESVAATARHHELTMVCPFGIERERLTPYTWRGWRFRPGTV